MDEVAWDEQSNMPPPIQLSLFLFFSALPNELKEEIKKELTGTAAPRECIEWKRNGVKWNFFGMKTFPAAAPPSQSTNQQSNQSTFLFWVDWWSWLVVGWVGWDEWVVLFFCGLVAAAAAMLRKREENNNTIHQFQFNKLKKESELMKQNEVNLLMELIY